MLLGCRTLSVTAFDLARSRPALLVSRLFVSEARNMPAHVVLEPEGTTVATHSERELLEQLLPFTFAISGFRGKAFTERGLLVHYKPQAEACPAQRPPGDSYICITYPFSTNQSLRDQYQRFTSNFLRVGLLLEDLDSFAADVASRHIGGLPQNATVVTASVEKIAFATAIQHRAQQQQQQHADITTAVDVAAAAAAAQQQRSLLGSRSDAPMSIYQDLRIAGQVCWAGRSSMEVVIEISTRAAAKAGETAAAVAAPAANSSGGSGSDGSSHVAAAPGVESSSATDSSSSSDGWIHRAVAHFVMVLRPTGADAEAGRSSSSGSSGRVQVPQIVPSNEIEHRNFEAAAARSADAKAKRASKRLLGVEPAGDEVRLLYDLAEQQLLREIREKEANELLARQGSRSLFDEPLPAVPIHSTTQSHLAIMHRQDRNNANNIFGGHLLRLAAELAYSTAVLHAGRHCESIALGDVTFKQPVPIGCVLEFRAKVVYTAGHLMRVTVVATKHQQLIERPSELHASVTNDFTFVLAAVGAHELRPVEPQTLREVVQYLAAHRQHVADGYQAPRSLLQEGMEHVLLG